MTDEIVAHLLPGETVMTKEFLELAGFDPLAALQAMNTVAKLTGEDEDDDTDSDV